MGTDAASDRSRFEATKASARTTEVYTSCRIVEEVRRLSVRRAISLDFLPKSAEIRWPGGIECPQFRDDENDCDLGEIQ